MNKLNLVLAILKGQRCTPIYTKSGSKPLYSSKVLLAEHVVTITLGLQELPAPSMHNQTIQVSHTSP